ncbi:MAG: glycosyltransferase family 2 protein [Fimbriimonadaceae bacterium]|nr:glycosyltransferase family 2 protein [Fimbriimonadaceae bacterium]
MTSVVIVTFYSAATIESCLCSVLDHAGPRADITVVDNGSKDGTCEIVTVFASRESRLKFLRNDENLGYSRALNIGLRAAKGDTLVCLNPDTEVTKGWLEPLEAALQLPDVGAVGPVSDTVGGAQFLGHYANKQLPDKGGIARWMGRHYRGQTEETKLLIGFCVAFKREVIEKVGMMDEDLFLGADDLDYSWRLRQAGYRLLVCKDAFVHHEGGVSFASLPSDRKAELVRQSDLALRRKLEAHYGDLSRITSDYLFGCDIFEHILREG